MIDLFRRLVAALETLALEARVHNVYLGRQVMLQERAMAEAAEIGARADVTAREYAEAKQRYAEYLNRQQIAESLDANLLQ